MSILSGFIDFIITGLTVWSTFFLYVWLWEKFKKDNPNWHFGHIVLAMIVLWLAIEAVNFIYPLVSKSLKIIG